MELPKIRPEKTRKEPVEMVRERLEREYREMKRRKEERIDREQVEEAYRKLNDFLIVQN